MNEFSLKVKNKPRVNTVDLSVSSIIYEDPSPASVKKGLRDNALFSTHVCLKCINLTQVLTDVSNDPY